MYLLDTNTVIYFCNSKLPLNAKELLQNIQPAISFITHIELFASTKISEEEDKVLKEFIAISKIYNQINQTLVDKTVELRKNYRIKLPDAIIAATALVYDLTLITRNTADFNTIKALKLINPYQVD
jgi:hypothetical protein